MLRPIVAGIIWLALALLFVVEAVDIVQDYGLSTGLNGFLTAFAAYAFALIMFFRNVGRVTGCSFREAWGF